MIDIYVTQQREEVDFFETFLKTWTWSFGIQVALEFVRRFRTIDPQILLGLRRTAWKFLKKFLGRTLNIRVLLERRKYFMSIVKEIGFRIASQLKSYYVVEKSLNAKATRRLKIFRGYNRRTSRKESWKGIKLHIEDVYAYFKYLD